MSAKITLPSIFSDNMVLQRETKVALWGSADAGKKVTITPSWTNQKVVVTAGKDGKWSTKVQTPAAGGPYTITFSDGDKLTLSNILIGEVWYCSGQSNMEMPVRGFSGQPVEGSFDAIMNASPDVPIRMCTSKVTPSCTPLEDNVLKYGWSENTPEAVAAHSAVSYFFAQQLYNVLKVPIGVIATDLGGSSIEAWLSRDVIESQFINEFDISYLDKGELVPNKLHLLPCYLFNGMVNPLIPFTFKGRIWYQGCTNRGRAEQYVRLQNAYVAMMRELFENEEIPFYCVQIAPYVYDNADGRSISLIQEAQLKSVQSLSHAGIATTLDVGNPVCIHPSEKKEVGQRLAALALVNDYGFKGIVARAPEYKGLKVDGNKAVVSFDCFGASIGPIFTELGGFEVAGEDKVFHPATSATVNTANFSSVIVTCNEVEKPVAVRYAFKNVSNASLFNDYGIPVGPFRTDSWEE